MIIRENEDFFILIEQHHHATISSYLFQQLNESILPSNFHSLNEAILNHDYGWIPFDRTPIWNDTKSRPYSFIDFPISFKTILYRYGIDYVHEIDPYAALLCSQHYCRFLKKNDGDLVGKFLHDEKNRQENIIARLTYFDDQTFQLHLSILQFFDSLSLYICLNEPGVNKENEHPYFKKGIPIPASFGDDSLQAEWLATDEIRVDKRIFKENVHFHYQYKQVKKEAIKKKGIAEAYNETKYDQHFLKITN